MTARIPGMPKTSKPVVSRSAKRAIKALDEKITRLAQHAVMGITIPILEIPAICRVGHQAAAEGKDDVAIEAAMAAYIETIRVDRKAV